MEKMITAAAFATLAVGGRHLYRYLSEKRKRALDAKKVEVWEGEGGAVPVARDRTAAQVRPRARS